MENQQPEQDKAAQEAALQKVEQAFADMGQALLAIAQQQQVMGETISHMLKDRNAQLEMIGNLTQRLQSFLILQNQDRDNVGQLVQKVAELANFQNQDHANLQVLFKALGGHGNQTGLLN